MAEDDAINDEKLLILPLNDKNSKKISQVISSDTARNILEVLASTSRSASEIAEKLGIPLTTVQYNLEKLYDAGLVKV
ncbi:MAG: helix-turn-helix transcriptional regulator, partial [Methanosarcinales archaeon]|nr:helix-turn-helix transcriptional regulator [Methanosarcinales archaeon]